MRKKILCSIGVFILLITTIFNVVLADDNDGIMLINEEVPVENRIMPRTVETPTEDDGIMPINDEIPVEENTVGADEIKQELYINAKNILEENDYSFAKDIIKDSEIINGNTFLCGETVELKNVTINGDLFVTASKLKISNEANLNGNVFIFAGNVEFDGKVAREMFAFVKDMVFGENATVMYNVNIAADHISLNGTCYRSVNVTVENMEVKDRTVVLGNLNYVSEKEAAISESAVITNTNFSKYVEEKKQVIDIVVEKVLDFSRYFILVMVVFIVIMKYLPTVIEKSKKNLSVSSFGLGIAAIILIPIILVALLMLHVFTSVVFAALLLLMLILVISNAITNIAIAKVISDKKTSLKLPISVAIITVINWIIYQIPIVGGLIAFIWLITGLGISIKNCFTKNK